MTAPENPMIALSLVKPEVVSWLWPGHLALGTLAMFDGDPGRGKSLITLDLCARVTTGRPMPDGSGGDAPANVAIIQAEDSVAETVRARLQALGADLDRVFVFKAQTPEQKPFQLPGGAKSLGAAMSIIQPRLVIIDPIMAFLGPDIAAYSEQSVRRALGPLAALVAEYRCTAILVRHLGKAGYIRALYRGLTSIGFNALCRSAWLFDADPHDSSRSIMAQIKLNGGPDQPSLAYRIAGAPGGEPVVEWLGPSDLLADELGARRRPGRPPLLVSELAEDFLPAFLSGGPRPTEEIWPAALEAGIPRRTLQAARRRLGIRWQRVWNGQKQLTYWLLSGQTLPASIPPEHRHDDVDELFAAVKAKYPDDPLEEEE